MAWHDDLQLEIAVEFQRLSAPHWERFVDRFWIGIQIGKRAWSEHGLWWRRTTTGRRYFAAYARLRAARLKKVVVAVRHCVACRKPFEVSEYRARRRRDRVCSKACRGAARKNIELVCIGGEAKPLAEWSRIHSIDLKTVWRRIHNLGWDPARALRTPALPRGRRKAA